MVFFRKRAPARLYGASYLRPLGRSPRKRCDG